MGHDFRDVSFPIWKHSLRMRTEYELAGSSQGSSRFGRRRVPHLDYGHYQRYHYTEGASQVPRYGRFCMGAGHKHWGKRFISHLHQYTPLLNFVYLGSRWWRNWRIHVLAMGLLDKYSNMRCWYHGPDLRSPSPPRNILPSIEDGSN